MPRAFIESLKKKGLIVDEVQNPSPSLLKQLVKEYHVIVVRSSTNISSEIIEAGERLRIIARAGAGIDNIDLDAAERRRVKVINVPEAVANAVAELTLCLILILVRGVHLGYRTLLKGYWIKHDLIGREIDGMKIGVVGLGHIGSLVAKKLSLLGAKVLAYRRDRALLYAMAERHGYTPVETLTKLVENSDLVTLHVPYTRDTHHLFNEKILARFREGAYLVNTSRAWIVDGKALIKLLDNNTLEGVAIDVHYNEPPREEWEWRLIRHPRVIATPHIGAQTREAKARIASLLADKILAELDKL